MENGRRTAREKLLALAFAERGAVLWIPSLLLAAAAVLFAIRLAPGTPFNQSRDLRVALGPVQGSGATAAARREFETGLRQGLAAQRELVLMDAELVRARLRATLGTPAPPEPLAWMRSTRALNVRYYVTGALEPRPVGFAARVQVWNVASERTLCTLDATAAAPEPLGRSLADSVGVALFRPGIMTAATRP
jgi:hypothetical protein